MRATTREMLEWLQMTAYVLVMGAAFFGLYDVGYRLLHGRWW